MAVVAIARQHSSLGHAIGRMVADRMGCHIVDNTTVGVEAGPYGATIEVNGADLEEHEPTLLERLRDERQRHRIMLRCAVTNTAAAGDVVIVGLASPVILRDVTHVLKVAVVANQETRVRRLVERARTEEHRELSNEDAWRLLRRSDRQRAGYLRYHFNSEWLDPLTHDLMINTSFLTPEVAVNEILHMVERPELQPTAESREHLANLAINCRIEAEHGGHGGSTDDGLSLASWTRLR
jgi:cytidylate kinase